MAQRGNQNERNLGPRLISRRGQAGLAILLLTAAIGCSQRRARHDVNELQEGLAIYRHSHGEYPQGSGPQICSILLGKNLAGQNPRQIAFIEARPGEINQQGEFVDPWGIPYQIVISGSTARIYSCGPNKLDEQGGGDDILAQPKKD